MSSPDTERNIKVERSGWGLKKHGFVKRIYKSNRITINVGVRNENIALLTC